MITDRKSFMAGLWVGQKLGRRIIVGIIAKFIRANGIYRASDEGADGYSMVTVDVPNTYTAGDEGKVVQSGELIAQTTRTVTEHGGYDTTLNDTVLVNVSGGVPGVYSGTAAPAAALGNDGDMYVRKYSLPDGVHFVDYLRTSGTQWIETGLYGNLNTGLYVEQIWNNDAAVEARYSATDRNIGVGAQTGGLLSLDFRTNRVTAQPTIGDRIKCYVGNFWYLLNGQILEARALSLSHAFTTPATFRLFAINATNSYGFVVSNGATICRATFRQDGLVIADYLPALDENDVPCMYEAVNGTYKYNSGTGTFLYGTDATPAAAFDVYKKIGGTWKPYIAAPAL